jgi:outer membrane protein W
MRILFIALFSIILISSLSFAEMKLKLSKDLTGEIAQSLVNKNLDLTLPSEIVPPSDMQELVKGLMLLGVLGDVSFPMGNDSGFKHIAGTAWSGHLEFSYMVSPAFRLMFRAGYINFGKQTEEGEEFGYSYNYEDTFSQIPILVGGYYMIPTASGFKPYIGVAVGAFFQTYKVNWVESYLGNTWTLDNSFSNTGFGVVPGIGAYYIAGSVLIQLAVEYTYVFSDGPTVDYGNATYTLAKLNKVAGITQDETTYEEPSDKASYFSVLLGVSFPVGK